MDANLSVTVKVPAAEKLLDYVASGVGSVAHFLVGRRAAKQQVAEQLILAQGDADVRKIQAEAESAVLTIIASAQEDARQQLIAPAGAGGGEVTIGDQIRQRLNFQEEKRHHNIAQVVQGATAELADVEDVPDEEPDHDWTARFFDEVKDVSSEEMQTLWSKVLAGEVERPGSTSIRTLEVLRNLDRSTALLFQRLCAFSMSLTLPEGGKVTEARAPFPVEYADGNPLKRYGVDYSALQVLNEYGLLTAEYNSWREYVLWFPPGSTARDDRVYVPFRYQNQFWILCPSPSDAVNITPKTLRIHGAALTTSGMELLQIVDPTAFEDQALAHARDLQAFFAAKNLQMIKVESGEPQVLTRR